MPHYSPETLIDCFHSHLGKKESRMQDSPPAAGRIGDIFPYRRSAILAERI